MAERTEIAWCDSTFNPWIGCTKVSPGCDNCYAARQDAFRHWTPQGWGAGQPRKRTAPANWKQPTTWNTRHMSHGFAECVSCRWRGEQPTTGKFCDCPACGGDNTLATARRRVFCSSLADVFDNEVPDAWRTDLWALIESTPNLDWLLLTKRVGNVMPMIPEHWALQRLPRNVWLGATMVNQEERDRDMRKLMAVPATVHFLSLEPLLGPIDLALPCGHDGRSLIDWVIVGGESGPGARPMHSELVRMLRDQCAAAGVPFLFKQWGEYLPGDADCNDPVWPDVPESRLFWIDGSKWDRFDGQRPGVSICARVGKKAAGRLLDGIEHNGFPEVS